MAVSNRTIKIDGILCGLKITGDDMAGVNISVTRKRKGMQDVAIIPLQPVAAVLTMQQALLRQNLLRLDGTTHVKHVVIADGNVNSSDDDYIEVVFNDLLTTATVENLTSNKKASNWFTYRSNALDLNKYSATVDLGGILLMSIDKNHNGVTYTSKNQSIDKSKQHMLDEDVQFGNYGYIKETAGGVWTPVEDTYLLVDTSQYQGVKINSTGAAVVRWCLLSKTSIN